MNHRMKLMKNMRLLAVENVIGYIRPICSWLIMNMYEARSNMNHVKQTIHMYIKLKTCYVCITASLSPIRTTIHVVILIQLCDHRCQHLTTYLKSSSPIISLPHHIVGIVLNVHLFSEWTLITFVLMLSLLAVGCSNLHYFSNNIIIIKISVSQNPNALYCQVPFHVQRLFYGVGRIVANTYIIS